MKKLTLIMTVFLAVFLTFPVCANSIYGVKGLMYMPTADTQPEGKFGLNFQISNSRDSKLDANRLSMNYGLWENVELFLNVKTEGNFEKPELFGGLKARVMQETKVQPALAIGLMNTDLFVVASKTLEPKYNIRGHIGFGTGTRQGVDDADPDSDPFGGLFFGFNKVYNPIAILHEESKFLLPMTNFELEFIKNQINFGMDVHLNQYFTLSLGLINFRAWTYGFGYSSQF